MNFGISAHNLIVLKFFFYIQYFRSEKWKDYKLSSKLPVKLPNFINPILECDILILKKSGTFSHFSRIENGV